MRFDIGERVVTPNGRVGTVRGSFQSLTEGTRYWVRLDDAEDRCFAYPARNLQRTRTVTEDGLRMTVDADGTVLDSELA